MTEIFISYRRDDALGHATAIYGRLEETFGSSEVFLDIARMQAGSKWQEDSAAQLASCSLCVVVIGKQWTPGRLRNPEDIVRLELEAALNDDKALIPVVVDGADLPRMDELPPSLRGLLSWQAVWLDPRSLGAYKQGLDTLAERAGASLMQQGRWGVIRVTGAKKHNPITAAWSIWIGNYRHERNVSILIDGRPVAKTARGEVLEFQVPVGKHVVQVIALPYGLGTRSYQSEVMTHQIRKGDFKCLVWWIVHPGQEDSSTRIRLRDGQLLATRPSFLERQFSMEIGQPRKEVGQLCFEDPPTKRYLVPSGEPPQ